MVIVFPLFFLLVFLGIQFALWTHGSHVALAAAQEGARTARVSRDAVAGESRANDFLNQLGTEVVRARRVQASVVARTARVDVWGTGLSILPGFTFTIHEHSEGPLEEFRGDTP
jgi:hypothetical protein